ncbi:hypothetical protein Tco_1325614, partial [Tanacetum coccineum]
MFFELLKLSILTNNSSGCAKQGGDSGCGKPSGKTSILKHGDCEVGDRVSVVDRVCEVLLLEVDFNGAFGGERDLSLSGREGGLSFQFSLHDISRRKLRFTWDVLGHMSCIRWVVEIPSNARMPKGTMGKDLEISIGKSVVRESKNGHLNFDFPGAPSDWVKFNSYDFTPDNLKEFRKRYSKLLRKEIEGPEALDYAEFSTLHDGVALQNLDQFCHVSYRHDDRIFTSQEWNKLFKIQEPVVKEYVMEFLSCFTFKDHVVELDIADTMVFQLGGVKRSMSMRQFILALGLYIPEEMNNNLFGPFRDACFRNRPKNYNPTKYFVGISTQNHYDTRHPPSYTTIRNPFVVWFIDGEKMVDVPYTVAKFLSEKAKGYKKKSLIVGSHLIGRIARYNGLGLGELVNDQLDNSEDEAVAAEAKGDRDEEGGVRHRP